MGVNPSFPPSSEGPPERDFYNEVDVHVSNTRLYLDAIARLPGLTIAQQLEIARVHATLALAASAVTIGDALEGIGDVLRQCAPDGAFIVVLDDQSGDPVK
jgi:hypothetical protein